MQRLTSFRLNFQKLRRHNYGKSISNKREDTQGELGYQQQR